MLNALEGVTPKNGDEQGLVWQHKDVDGKKYIGYRGGLWGIAALMFFNPDTKTGLILFTNGDWTGFFQYDRLKEKPIREIFVGLFKKNESGIHVVRTTIRDT